MITRFVCSVVGVTACSFSAAADGRWPGFDAEDSLRVTRILEQPQMLADGSAVAYVAANWEDETAIRAHKPLGTLRVYSPGNGSTVLLARAASDPAWSRSGRSLAWFEDLGSERELVVRRFPGAEAGSSGARFAVAGETSRYSARHFAPIWSSDDRFLVVAEALSPHPAEAESEPYTVAADTVRLPFDRHFRDDTLWQLVRIDLETGGRANVGPELALRAMTASPDGRHILVTAAKGDDPGQFVGDTYVSPLQYSLVTVTTGSYAPDVALPEDAVLLGWLDASSVAARSGNALALLDVETGQAATEAAPPVLKTAVGVVPAAGRLAVWGPRTSDERQRYVIAPPEPHSLTVVDVASGATHGVIEAGNREILQAVWLKPGSRLIVHARRLDTLDEQLILWSGGEAEVLLEVASSIGMIAAAAEGGLLVFAAETAVSLPELHALRLHDRRLSALTAHNAGVDRRDAAEPQLVRGSMGAGDPWQALLYRPSDAHGTEQALIVSAYGRQTDQRHRFHAEAQMHTARGYAYLLPDVFPARGALHAAYADVVPAAIEQVRRRHGIRGGTGFVGGSLGGYAGLVLLTRSDAADAAVLRAAPAEFALSWATGKDRDADLLEFLMSGDRPYVDPRAYHEDSPFWMAADIEAPTLFLHGTDDQQVPFYHSQWMFQALRRLGRAPVELRIYPGADHSIVRGSRANYLDFYRQVFDWWQRYLDAE